MTKPLIIGLCGRAGTGKTSVSQYLQEKGFQAISFAEPLKRMAMDIWGFSEEQVFGDASIKEAPDPRTGITPRWAMQQLGQAGRDHMGQYVWIQAAFAKIEAGGKYVFEDVRYCNEAAELHRGGGYVLRLRCSDSISTDDGMHPSEAEVDMIPWAHIFAELRSSRAQGLEHLFSLIDDALAKIDSGR